MLWYPDLWRGRALSLREGSQGIIMKHKASSRKSAAKDRSGKHSPAIKPGRKYALMRAEVAIGRFLRSLGEDQKGAAIGVILSGTASDGSLGIKAIKAAGGITFAQKEESAKFNEMPRNAIATGCVDFTLPTTDIAAELVRI